MNILQNQFYNEQQNYKQQQQKLRSRVLQKQYP